MIRPMSIAAGTLGLSLLTSLAIGADETAPATPAPAAAETAKPEAAVAVEKPADATAEAAKPAETKEAEATTKPTDPKAKPPEEQSAGDEIATIYPLDNEEWLKDPFLVLDMEMEAVVTDFTDGKSKPPAETTQPRILSRFDAVIAQLEKSCNGTGGGSGGPKPANASTIRKGPGGIGELVAPKKNGRGFEDLTPKEREKILQSKTEGFPPGFEDVLADYFRRLAKADEKPASAAGDEATPAAKP
jgi:hypothetical protein